MSVAIPPPCIRWRLRGSLVLTGPLRVGTGQSEAREFQNGKGGSTVADVAMVERDHAGNPFIPGSSLKGVLTAWMRSRIDVRFATVLDDLLGRGPSKEDGGLGGRVEFCDAFMRSSGPAVTTTLASTAIDRRTRTAKHRLLFQRDVVPAGTTFDVEILSDSLAGREMGLILLALNAFNDSDEVLRLGAETGKGLGRARWTAENVRYLDADGIAQWLSEDNPLSWWKYLGGGKGGARDSVSLAAMADEMLGETRNAKTAARIILFFSGPFLVNDPSRKQENEPDFLPRLDAAGRPCLPGSSAKGALRGQAERICRTVGTDAELVTILFGDKGRKGALEIDGDFCSETDVRQVDHEMVAIDRFTGGVAGSAKFNARYAECPKLKGTVRIDMARLGERRSETMGLFALLLRDLAEGDVTFGLGASKGYGACTAKIEIDGLDMAGFLRDSQRHLEAFVASANKEADGCSS